MKTWIPFIALAIAAFAQNADKPLEIDVSADKIWTNTGVDVAPGEMVAIETSGTITYMGRETGPSGLVRGWMDMIKTFPLNDAKRGALIGRIGDNPTSRPFLIGDRTERQIPVAGRLFLSRNHPLTPCFRQGVVRSPE